MTKAKRTRRAYGTWQLQRLMEFAHNEQVNAHFYEMCYEKLSKKIPFKVLSVMIFFEKEEYSRKPGSLVTLFRVAHSETVRNDDFERRYEKYYAALQEKGFL